MSWSYLRSLSQGMLPWESVPHWIGLKLQAHDESSWRWANGLPVTHTRWSSQPTDVVNSATDTCFAFAKVSESS